MSNVVRREVEVRVFATLRMFHPSSSRYEIETNTTVAVMLQRLGIPEDKAAILFRNGRHAELTETLESGDVLSIFPPIGGG